MRLHTNAALEREASPAYTLSTALPAARASAASRSTTAL